MKAVLIASIVAWAACGSENRLPVATLQDPNTCNECHPTHFAQWQSSMHAYASKDPVFVAMNKRGQQDTQNQLGTFCVQCHAPMAVALGLTDGTNFDPTMLPPEADGVTCYFCHNVKDVVDTHNNGLQLAMDQTMRGGLQHPIDSPAHASKYDTLMDSDTNNSEVCGSCHDIVTPKGVALERTYTEWQSTFFSQPDPQHHLTCGSCHMPSSTDVVADKPGLNVPERDHGFHEHIWPAIDQSLIADFPGQATMAMRINQDLEGAVAIIGAAAPGSNVPTGGICVEPLMGGEITVRVDSILVAHAWPSGAAQDRRAWLEVIGYDSTGAVKFHTGDVPDSVDPETVTGFDVPLVEIWDKTFDDAGMPAHFFWDVATHDASGLLRPPITLDKNLPQFDHSTTYTFVVGGTIQNALDHITARVRIRALPLRLLSDLGLDSLGPQIKTLDIVAANKTWNKTTAADHNGCNFPP
jgi:hypothetical protein